MWWNFGKEKKAQKQNAMVAKSISVNPPAAVSNLRNISRLVRLMQSTQTESIVTEIIARKEALKCAGFVIPGTLAEARALLNTIEGSCNGNNL